MHLVYSQLLKIMLGMSQYCNQWRSQKLAEDLSTSGSVCVCVGGGSVQKVKQQRKTLGTMRTQVFIGKNVDTPEGKNLFPCDSNVSVPETTYDG